MAQTVHWCDDCLHDIEPGSFYEGSVILNPNKEKYRVYVLKRHIEPPCPSGYFDEIEAAIEEGMGESELESVTLADAA